jgi:glutamine transport system substrate-binding protein
MIIFICSLFLSIFQTETITAFVRDTSTDNFNTKVIKQIIDLYNKRNEEKIELKLKKFPGFIPTFDLFKRKSGDHSILYINSITITNEREQIYDFSIGYFPIRAALISLKDNPLSIEDIVKSGLRVGIVEKTAFDLTFIKKHTLQRKHKLQVYKNIFLLHDALKIKKVDYYIGDALEAWYFDNKKLIDILYDAPFQKYGILYPEGSKLKEKLDPIIKYLIHSSSFYQIVKESFPNLDEKYFKIVRN